MTDNYLASYAQRAHKNVSSCIAFVNHQAVSKWGCVNNFSDSWIPYHENLFSGQLFHKLSLWICQKCFLSILRDLEDILTQENSGNQN